MSEFSIQIDPQNPAEYYACCGILELASLSGREPVSHFAWRQAQPRLARFTATSAPGTADLAKAIRQAKPAPLTRPGAHGKDPIAPVRLQLFGKTFDLDWWLDIFREQKSPLKCWSGQVTTRKLFDELPKLIAKADDLNADAFTSTRFGTDPRSAWEARDLGYSPNEHNQGSRTFPFTELLAAIGLQGFRPAANRRRCTYNLWLEPLPLEAARAASVAPWEGLRATARSFEIGTRGSYRYFTFASTERNLNQRQKEVTDE